METLDVATGIATRRRIDRETRAMVEERSR